MRPGQRECRHRGVVERSASPGCGCVAALARGCETSCCMTGIVRVVEVRLVAADTRCRESFVNTARVALLAGGAGVRPG